MSQISQREFERLPLRAHQFRAGVALHDVWRALGGRVSQQS